MKCSHLSSVGVLCFVAAGFVACVGGDDSVIPDSGTQQDATVDVSVDNVIPENDGSADVQVDAPTGCAARTADDTAGVFVSQALGTDTNGCGTRGNPCKSIAYGLATAKSGANKTTVYIAAAPPSVVDAGSDAGDAGDGGVVPGVYLESIILDAPITIEGGWSDIAGTWTPICDATTSTAVTLQGVDDKPINASFSGSATLRDVQVLSKVADDGETLYGIFATGATANLTLDAVVVNVAAGGAGVDGTAGVAGTAGATTGCTPGANVSAGATGPSGSAGGVGTGATAGTFTATGYVTTVGGDGGSGVNGTNGGIGGNGTCSGANACETCTSHMPTSTQCESGTETVCGGQGVAGCAGTAGTGGGFGTAGGSSAAIFAWDAHVTVFGGSFTTGNGGNGGAGGVGGGVGAGASGVVGGANDCNTWTQLCDVGVCFAPSSSVPEPGGTAGGKGGNGGSGAQGGGGSGGDSYVIVQGGAGAVVLNGGPTLVHGTGGAGGAAGGANGTASNQWP